MILLTARGLIQRRRSSIFAMETTKISNHTIQNVRTKEEIRMDSLWSEKTVVILFLRRFGCLFCRQSALELSALQPVLTAHDVRLVGIGLEELGVAEYVNGEYFSGELFLDFNRQSYTALGYRSPSIISLIKSMFSKSTREAIAKGRAMGIKGDFKGNISQNGGVLIVKKGGHEVLLSYRQENPADHVENSDVLEALGIQDPNEDQHFNDELVTVTGR